MYRITIKRPHTCDTSTHTLPPKCQISILLALQPVIFELQAISRQIHRMTPKWPWILNGQRYSIYMLQLPLSPKFQSDLLYDQLFSRYRPFLRHVHRMTPKWPWTVKGQRYPTWYNYPESQISIFFALRLLKSASHFLRYRPFWDIIALNDSKVTLRLEH